MREAGLVLAVMLLWAGVSPPLDATDAPLSESGNAFLRDCSSVDRPSSEHKTDLELMKSAVCASYVDGLDGGIRVEVDLINRDGRAKATQPYCLDPSVSAGQIVRILTKYIRDNPARAHWPTPILYLSAMEQAFPCPTQN